MAITGIEANNAESQKRAVDFLAQFGSIDEIASLAGCTMRDSQTLETVRYYRTLNTAIIVGVQIIARI